MHNHRIERIITIVLFFLVVLVFSIAQEKSRVLERVYTNKWNLNATVPAQSTSTPLAGQIKEGPVKAN